MIDLLVFISNLIHSVDGYYGKNDKNLSGKFININQELIQW